MRKLFLLAIAGVPETTRDCIVQASKPSEEDQCEQTRDLDLTVNIWVLMLREKNIREMSGRCLLLTSYSFLTPRVN